MQAVIREPRKKLTILLLVVAVILVTGCRGGLAQSSPTPAPTAVSGAEATIEPTAEPILRPPTPVPSTMQRLAGTYRFHPAGSDETSDYILVLRGDGSAELDEQPIGDENSLIQDAVGIWSVADDGQTVIFDVQTIFGQPARQEEFIEFAFTDGVPTVSAVQVNDQFVHLDNGVFTLGAGDSGPLIGELNKRLAALDYLGFVDPEDNSYGEETRRAVSNFQASQGLVPNGVVDVWTWLLLDNPQPPISTPVPLEPITGVPNLQDLPSQTEDGRPIVYLTFDDGPDPNNTPELLDLLDEYDAKVTFFNVGLHVQESPQLVRDAATRGHYIADHTWDHQSLQGISPQVFIEEANRTRDAILEAAGDLFMMDRNVRYLRPPYGATDANTAQLAAQQGYALVLWTIDPQDWRRPGASVIANHILEHVYPGAIVLSHDGYGDRSQTVEAYRTVLPALQEQGYVFNTVFLP